MLSRESNKKIDLTHFRKPDQNDGLHPTSKWHLKWVEPFCDVQFMSGLGFTKSNLQNAYLLPEERVFAECPARRDDIVKGRWDLGLNDIHKEARPYVKKSVGATFMKLQRVLRHHAVDIVNPDETLMKKWIRRRRRAWMRWPCDC